MKALIVFSTKSEEQLEQERNLGIEIDDDEGIVGEFYFRSQDMMSMHYYEATDLPEDHPHRKTMAVRFINGLVYYMLLDPEIERKIIDYFDKR